MSDIELSALYRAFRCVFADLVHRGYVGSDQNVDDFFVEFLDDLARHPHDWPRQLVS